MKGEGFETANANQRHIWPDLDTTLLQEQKIAQLREVWCRPDIFPDFMEKLEEGSFPPQTLITCLWRDL